MTTIASTPTTPVPSRPKVPADIAEIVGTRLFSGSYTATERDTWRVGLPLLGTKVSSTRDVAFTNDFNVLDAGGKMVEYVASSFDDAVRGARDLAWGWSDPAFGGQIYDSVAVAVLQAKDGNYFTALVGSGDPRTSGSELGYRSDRFDGNIRGSFKRADDARPTSGWTAPVDGDGRPVDEPAPDDAAPISRRQVRDVRLERLTNAPDALKAIVDVNQVYLPEGG